MRTTTYLAGGAFALFLAMATPGFALDTDVYLSVRTAVPVVEHADAVLGVQADASATAQSSQEDEASQSSSSADASMYAVSSSSVGFLEKLYAWFASLGFGSSSSSEGDQTASGDVHATRVSAHSAVIILPPALASLRIVYYSTTSPVVVASSTPHATPWRFWRKNEVAIHGLVPDTMYFYRVVGDGTTTAEASFRTRTQ